jgi:hypothetical protein
METPFEIIPGLSFEEYGKRPGINGSLLVDVWKEPLATVRAMLDGKREKSSEALDFGTAFHSLILEGKREFIEQPATYPGAKGEEKPWTYQANFCKEWKATQTQTVLTRQEIADLDGMANAVCAYDQGGIRLNDYLKGQAELSIFAEQKGTPVKIRVDLLPDDPDMPVIDFKKSRSADPVKFTRQAFDLGYHLKAAFYLDVLRLIGKPRKAFWFVSVEQEYPHNIAIVKMEDAATGFFIPAGRRLYRAAMLKLLAALENGRWPTYGDSSAEDNAPQWMAQQLEAA